MEGRSKSRFHQNTKKINAWLTFPSILGLFFEAGRQAKTKKRVIENRSVSACRGIPMEGDPGERNPPWGRKWFKNVPRDGSPDIHVYIWYSLLGSPPPMGVGVVGGRGRWWVSGKPNGGWRVSGKPNAGRSPPPSCVG